MKSSTPKTLQTNPIPKEDRISELSDDILFHILSFFTTKFTVQTSILSKRWHYVWTSSPILIFTDEEFTSVAKLINFVAHVLIRRNAKSDVKTFSLRWHRGFKMGTTTSWLQYAVTHNVRNLKLDLYPGPGGEFKLPDFFFNYPFLEDLDIKAPAQFFEESNHKGKKIYSCQPSILAFPDTKNLQYLKYLRLCYTEPIHYTSFGQEISRFPSLENLVMSISDDFEMSVEKLKSLAIVVSGDAKPLNIKINAPRLEFVRCRFSALLPEFSIEVQNSLVDARIWCSKELNNGNGSKLINILRCLRNTKSLNLYGSTVELLSTVLAPSNQILFPFCNLKKLRMEVMLNKENFWAIAMLLQSCPKIEEFIVYDTKEIKMPLEHKWQIGELNFDEYDLFSYLNANGIALNKMIIKMERGPNHNILVDSSFIHILMSSLHC